MTERTWLIICAVAGLIFGVVMPFQVTLLTAAIAYPILIFFGPVLEAREQKKRQRDWLKEISK
jgi:hypothetical protein